MAEYARALPHSFDELSPETELRAEAGGPLNAQIALLRNFFEDFLVRSTPNEKLVLLEEIYFFVQMEFEEDTAGLGAMKANYAVKMGILATGRVFEIAVHFKIALDFHHEAHNEFICEEFLGELDIIISSLLN